MGFLRRWINRNNVEVPDTEPQQSVQEALEKAGNDWLTREEQVTDEWSRYGEIK